MSNIRLYAIGSTLLISLVALIGIIFLGFHQEKLKKIVIYLVSFSAGALLGDVFIHLLPEIAEEGFSLQTSLFILAGILF